MCFGNLFPQQCMCICMCERYMVPRELNDHDNMKSKNQKGQILVMYERNAIT